jgi:hypothetical protein
MMETFMNLLAGLFLLMVSVRFFRMLISAVRGAVIHALHLTTPDRKVVQRHRTALSEKKRTIKRNSHVY